MIFDYRFEHFHNWKETHDITFKRKLENETAFDGIVKIYSLKTSSAQLNKLLNGKFFGDFFYPSQYGAFLRMFEGKDTWPNTTLIYVDLKKLLMIEILKTDSSWNVWSTEDLGNGKFSIAISPTENIEYQVA